MHSAHRQRHGRGNHSFFIFLYLSSAFVITGSDGVFENPTTRFKRRFGSFWSIREMLNLSGWCLEFSYWCDVIMLIFRLLCIRYCWKHVVNLPYLIFPFPYIQTIRPRRCATHGYPIQHRFEIVQEDNIGCTLEDERDLRCQQGTPRIQDVWHALSKLDFCHGMVCRWWWRW